MDGGGGREEDTGDHATTSIALGGEHRNNNNNNSIRGTSGTVLDGRAGGIEGVVRSVVLAGLGRGSGGADEGKEAEVLTLPQFFRKYVPALPPDVLVSDADEDDRADGDVANAKGKGGGGGRKKKKKKKNNDDADDEGGLLSFLVRNTLVSPLESCVVVREVVGTAGASASGGGSSNNGGEGNENPYYCCCCGNRKKRDATGCRRCGSRRSPPITRQSLSSLVDDVVWSLVQRNERQRHCASYYCSDHRGAGRGNGGSGKRTGTAKPNLLCQGYVVSECGGGASWRSGNASSGSSRRCLTRTHINGNVDYCKSSRLFRHLHVRVGDDAMRLLLAHSSVFVPVVAAVGRTGGGENNGNGGGRGNFMQLTGPPPRPGPLLLRGRRRQGEAQPANDTNSGSGDGTGKRRKRNKRKRSLRGKPSSPAGGVQESYESSSNANTSTIPEYLRPHSVLPRKELFYSNSFVPKVGLPSNHILNDPSSTPIALLDAMADLAILKTSDEGDGRGRKRRRRRRKRYARLGEEGIGICREILRRHRSCCDYARILERHCPLPEICRSRPRGRRRKRIGRHGGSGSEDKAEGKISLEDAAAAHSSTDGVVSFVQSCLRRVLPPSFLGSEENMDRLLDNHVSTFVRLRRQEQLPNKCLVNGIRLTKVRWLFANKEPGAGSKVSRSDHQAAELLLVSALRWLFGQYVIPLLSANFHVTESEFSGKQVLYYRKPAWSIFRSLSMKKLLNDQYLEISADDATARMEHQWMGLSRLRLLPKATGVRPIATLCKRENLRLRAASSNRNSMRQLPADDAPNAETGPVRKKRKLDHNPPPAAAAALLARPGDNRSTNQILNDAFTVLQFEQKRQGDELFGAGLDGLHYFYPRYRCFIEKLRNESQGSGRKMRIYFGSVDIKHCFDTIDQEHLLDVVENVLQEDDYIIQRYDVFHPFESMGRVFQRKRKRAGPPEDFHPFYRVVGDIADNHHQTIFADGVKSSLAKKDHLMDQLREHLTSHLVTVQGRYNDRFLVQQQGIPQGSVLSTLLCNLYYGSVERDLLPSQLRVFSKDLLVRMVDDFLLITTDIESLKSFLKRMYQGEPRLGVNINKAKTQVSAPVTFEDVDRTPCLVTPDLDTAGGRFFSWCGMMFEVDSGEVRVDYSRFFDGKGGDVLTVDRVKGQGDRLAVAMKTFVRPRCIPILFDASINCTRTQLINFYQLLVFGAVKTGDYLRSSDIVATRQSNVSFLLTTIESTISYTFNLINERLKHHHPDYICSTGFKRPAAMWLGWKAFYDTLQLLPDLEELQRGVKKKLMETEVHDSIRFTAAEALNSISIRRLFSFQSM